MEVTRHMIHGRLKARLATASLPLESHLDEDAICAFVEGRLEEAEVSPVTSHLIACAACRQTTVQLIRLGTQFDAENDLAVSPESPGRVRLFLDGLASRLAPSFEEDAVFAYHEPETAQDTEAVTDSKPEKPEDGA
jgi:hypothetical protein